MKKFLVLFVATSALYAAVASQIGATAGSTIIKASIQRDAQIEAMTK